MAAQITEARLRILLVTAVALFSMLVARLWFLQVLAVDEARAAAARNSLRLVTIPAPRGRILDVRGTVLVGNRLSLQITVNRQAVGDDRPRVLAELSRLLGVSTEEMAERLDNDRYYAFTPIPVAFDVPKEVAFYVLEHRDELPGVDVRKAPVRVYPQRWLAPHVVGYLGEISPTQLEDPSFSAYRPGDVVGKAGIEAVYERELRGDDGFVSYRVDSTGKNLGEFGRQDPTTGDDVLLTLDARIQDIAQESLRLGIENVRRVTNPATGRPFVANAGAVVVMDAQTGALRAVASFPGFTPDVFISGLTVNEYDARFGAATGYPLLNRAIQGQYPPGSTFKPWIMLSALDRSFVRTSQTYACPGSWSVPGDTRLFRNWDPADQGLMTLSTALSRSCDTIFYPMGYEYWRTYYPPPNQDGIPGNDDAAPDEPLQEDLRRMGFDRPTGVDLPSEYDGRIPDSRWKRSIHEKDPKNFPYGDWVPGDFVNMSIGQGDTLVTPMQIAQTYGMLLNGGRLCTPHLLSAVRSADGTIVRRGEDRCRRVGFPREHLDYIRAALATTVRTGTAAGAFSGFPFSAVEVAGKTGTSQVFGKDDFSWFVGMASEAGRDYIVVTVVEQGGHGSTTAAPIARRVIEGLFGLPLSTIVPAGATD